MKHIDDKLLGHLAKLVKKDAKPGFHNKPGISIISFGGRKNVWEVRQIMTEKGIRRRTDKDACYHKIKSRYKV